jgi:hypothetical protein
MRHAIFLLAALAAGAGDDDLQKLRAVGREGAGHEEAAAAWKAVVARGPAALLPVLGAFRDADPRAANWLRSAADAIAERALAAGQPLDAKALEGFVSDTKQDGAARRIAYEWLAKVDPAAPERLLPGMLDDPGRELRRDAVARAIREAEKTLKDDKPAGTEALRRAFRSARDVDQVNGLAKQLKSLGVEIDFKAHYGLIDRWVLVASFDNSGMKGYDVAYEPEKGVDLKASYPGKGGTPARVVDYTTPDPQAKVDLNAALGKQMGVVAYAWAVVESAEERAVELRLATNNAVKVFVNGELAFFRNEYHHGMKLDQYVARVRLRKGPNGILLKVCQNEQKDDWAQTWSFQARLCDALGGAVPFRVVTEAPPK